jgi:hypothetical protein
MSDPAPTNKRSPVFLKSGGFKLSLVDLRVEAISVRVAERPHRRSSRRRRRLNAARLEPASGTSSRTGTAEAPDKTGRRLAMAKMKTKYRRRLPRGG